MSARESISTRVTWASAKEAKKAMLARTQVKCRPKGRISHLQKRHSLQHIGKSACASLSKLRVERLRRRGEWFLRCETAKKKAQSKPAPLKTKGATLQNFSLL